MPNIKSPFGIPPEIVERERLRVKQERDEARAKGSKRLPNGRAQFKYPPSDDGITYTLSPNKKSPHGLEVKRASSEAAKESDRRGRKIKQADDLTPEQERRRLQNFEDARFLSDLTGIPHHVEHIRALVNGGSSNHPDNQHITSARHNYAKGSSTSGPAFKEALLNGQRNGAFLRRIAANKLPRANTAELIELFAEMHGSSLDELTAASDETTSRMEKMSDIARKNGGINGTPDLGITELFAGRSFVQDERQDFKR